MGSSFEPRRRTFDFGNVSAGLEDAEQWGVQPFIHGENQIDRPARAFVRITQPCISSLSTAPYTMGCARFNVGFIVGFQNEISGLVRRLCTSSGTCFWINRIKKYV